MPDEQEKRGMQETAVGTALVGQRRQGSMKRKVGTGEMSRRMVVPATPLV